MFIFVKLNLKTSAMQTIIDLKNLTPVESTMCKFVDIVASQNKIDCFITNDCWGNTHILGSDIDFGRVCNIIKNSVKLN